MAIKTIGIVGGGQLGQMMTEAALALGFKIVVVDPNPNCSAAQAGATQIMGSFDDADAIRKLADQVDVITIESEHINTDVLAQLEAEGMAVTPAVKSIQVTKDKWLEKQFLHDAGIPAAESVEISSVAEAEKVLAKFGGRVVIKLRIGGYDGKGNAVIKNRADIERVFAELDATQLYAENFVPFTKELAVMVVRDRTGNLVNYPVVETIQANNICHQVLAPAEIDEIVRSQAEALALKTVQNLPGAGLFGVEMFVDNNGQVLVNEIAPRVHNSGHYTIEACKTSQFEQHIRAITDLPLGDTIMTVPAAVMINILGDHNAQANPQGLEKAEQISRVKVHLYGKPETREGRKMGHIIATADTIEVAKQKAEKAQSLITI